MARLVVLVAPEMPTNPTKEHNCPYKVLKYMRVQGREVRVL